MRSSDNSDTATIYAGFRLSHPSNVTPNNPKGWVPWFMGDWWALYQRILQSQYKAVFMRGGLGSNYRNYNTPNTSSLQDALDLNAFIQALWTQGIAVAGNNESIEIVTIGEDKKSFPLIVVNGRDSIVLTEECYILLDPTILDNKAAEIVASYSTNSMVKGIVVPNKYLNHKWPESLATWDGGINFIGITHPGTKENNGS